MLLYIAIYGILYVCGTKQAFYLKIESNVNETNAFYSFKGPT
jgi:hypothetical protein